MVCAPSALSPAFHAHECELANQVERFFSTITTRRIRRGTFESVAALETAIHDYLAHYNEHCTPFVWTATADVILDKSADFANELQGHDTSRQSAIHIPSIGTPQSAIVNHDAPKYPVYAGGRRFLMMPRVRAEASATLIDVVVNFVEELRQRIR